jgi:hypothetical protein
MPNNVEEATRLLKEAADFFRSLSARSPEESSALEKRAQVYDEASARLTTASGNAASNANGSGDSRPAVAAATPEQKAVPPAKGPWLARCSWLDDDIPLWIQQGTADSKDLWTACCWSACPGGNPDHEAWTAALLAEFEEKERDAVLKSEVRFARPAFLPGVTFAHLCDSGVRIAFFSITKEGSTYKATSFNFQSAEAHRLNSVTPLNCARHELAYLRYFMYVVRGEKGAFRLLEGPVLKQAATHLEKLDWGEGRLLDSIHGPRFKRIQAGGCLVFTAHILYDRAVFAVELQVCPDGNVTMLNDERMAGDIEGLSEVE